MDTSVLVVVFCCGRSFTHRVPASAKICENNDVLPVVKSGSARRTAIAVSTAIMKYFYLEYRNICKPLEGQYLNDGHGSRRSMKNRPLRHRSACQRRSWRRGSPAPRTPDRGRNFAAVKTEAVKTHAKSDYLILLKFAHCKKHDAHVCEWVFSDCPKNK